MAEIGRESGKGTKDSKTRRKIRNKARGRIGERKASTKKKAVEEVFCADDASAENGADLLRKAAGSVVGRNSEKLAKLLLDNALAGDLNSAKLLVTLAERKKPREEPAKEPFIGPRLPTLAEWLAVQPQWEPGDPELEREFEREDRRNAEEEGEPEY